jgi:hypothetical protein
MPNPAQHAAMRAMQQAQVRSAGAAGYLQAQQSRVARGSRPTGTRSGAGIWKVLVWLATLAAVLYFVVLR